MAKSKKRRLYNGNSYCEVQSLNTKYRSKLSKEDQKWLKKNGYKNIGWNNVIALSEKIEFFLEKYESEGDTLEELFLEADRIGNKYLTREEIEDFNKKLSDEVHEIHLEIENQFLDDKIEVIDFYNKNKTMYKF